MLILTIRTDKPEAEIGLYNGADEISYYTWQAHRQLAETIHLKIQEKLTDAQHNLHDIEGIVLYKGPGSFTGLRIGTSVANALADSLGVPIVGETGDTWQQNGIARVVKGENTKIVMPEYGAPVHITLPRR